MKTIIIFFSFIHIFYSTLYGVDDINFTSNEIEYIKNKNPIKVCYTKFSFPFVIKNNHKLSGISIDYFNLISQKTNLKFKMIETSGAKQKIEFIKKGKCDITALISTNFNNHNSLVATHSIGEDNLVLVTKNNQPYIANFSDLKNKKIAIRESSSNIIQYIKKLYPNLTIVPSKGLGLKMVYDEKVYGAISVSLKMSYRIMYSFKDDLKIMGRVGDKKISGSLGVSVNEPILLSILNKTIIDISPQEKQQILKSWYNVKVEKGIDKIYLIKVGLIILAIFIFIILFIFILKRRIKIEIDKNREKDKHLFHQSRLAQMGEMTSMIAHQWRQPLGNINNIITVTQLDFMTTQKKINKNYINQQFEQIQKQVKFLSSTIDDFRNFYRPSKDKELISLCDCVKECLTLIGKELSDKHNITIDTHYLNKEEINIHKNEVVQVILNILNNSKDNFKIKNIQHSIIKIVTKQENNKYILSICDNGGGIINDTLPNIFDPYFSTKDEKNNTGLGLYMSKMIIEEHHKGKLGVKNIANGVCFSIEF